MTYSCYTCGTRHRQRSVARDLNSHSQHGKNLSGDVRRIHSATLWPDLPQFLHANLSTRGVGPVAVSREPFGL